MRDELSKDMSDTPSADPEDEPEPTEDSCCIKSSTEALKWAQQLKMFYINKGLDTYNTAVQLESELQNFISSATMTKKQTSSFFYESLKYCSIIFVVRTS